MIIRILPNDLIRVHIAEVNPLNGRQRFEATDGFDSRLVYLLFVSYRVHQRATTCCCIAR